MKKLLEMYQEKMEQRKEKQKEVVKEYVRKARVRRVVEKLLPYKEEILDLIEVHGVDETRRIVNTSLGLKIRSAIFNEAIQYLKQEPQNQKK
ncbi:MAG: hypothetical protein QW607_04200 [Desulfurococcaceae archaeon]